MILLLTGKDQDNNVIDVPRNPITPEFLIDQRVNGKNDYDRKLLQDNEIDTACITTVDPDKSGEVVIGLYSDPIVKELIHSLNPEMRISHHSLVISKDLYEAIKEKGFVFSPDVAYNLRRNQYNEKKIREAAWEFILEGQSKLFQDYLKLIKKKSISEMSDNRIGGWSLPIHPGLQLLCALPVGYVSDDSTTSYSSELDDDDSVIYCESYLDCITGHIIGVASDTIKDVA